MILIHLVERSESVIGACVESQSTGIQTYVTISEAAQLTDTPVAEWIAMDLETIDYRNLNLTANNTSTALIRLIKQGS